ncbi:hypothetical protein [Candidatus Tisiphia endosymbiont of Hybos culiciformis]|uniref:hypothetical protein n=1 Tax=Candidatus Tisiphia endosymbiont of Hybos culiciformis TaxID=3139331 RepID=UPI003CCA7DD0
MFALLIEGFEYANVIADKAYDSDAFIGQIVAQNSIPIIPPKRNHKIQRHMINIFIKNNI